MEAGRRRAMEAEGRWEGIFWLGRKRKSMADTTEENGELA
jgi:hypothetical protein